MHFSRLRNVTPLSADAGLACLFFFVAMLANIAFAQQVTVDITPGHSTNSISPLRAIGAGIDRDPLNSTSVIYGFADVKQMLSSGMGEVSYRLNTELSVQAWHWNPLGSWSGGSNGYFVGSSTAGPISKSFGYNLPHRGVTSNYGTSSGYSRLDDGDTTTYWKSNPYLSDQFTHDAITPHPQWVMVDLGSRMGVNAIRIAWANPYATDYEVQYWTGDDAIGNQGSGTWRTFPQGTGHGGRGGTVTLKIASLPLTVEYVRVLMHNSSHTCDTHGPGDLRNCVGFAINELYLGRIDSRRTFTDLMNHSPDSSQTLTYCSSVDSWHDATRIATDDGEQPGFDLVYRSGLTRNLPVTIPVAMLYDNPDSAASEIAYLKRRGFSIKYVEMGEEPDGQFILPEDYGALYLQWADAIRAIDPQIKLAGPIFEGVNDDIQVWPDSSGNTSWFTRFLNYLTAHGRISELNVMTFEHYPFDPCNITWQNLYDESKLVRHIMRVWRDDGLPSGVPMEITEANLAFDQSVRYMQPFAALWAADFIGTFLSAGGKSAYLYQYEPLPMYQGCGGWGTFGMFNADSNYHVKQYAAQYFAAQFLTQQWAQPIDALHRIYPASSNVIDGSGNTLVTVYSISRPDGQWALLLVNRDANSNHSVYVVFEDQSSSSRHYFNGNVTEITVGAPQYTWHPEGANGYARPDGPPVTSTQRGGRGVMYALPKQSITVLRGVIQ